MQPLFFTNETDNLAITMLNSMKNVVKSNPHNDAIMQCNMAHTANAATQTHMLSRYSVPNLWYSLPSQPLPKTWTKVTTPYFTLGSGLILYKGGSYRVLEGTPFGTTLDLYGCVFCGKTPSGQPIYASYPLVQEKLHLEAGTCIGNVKTGQGAYIDKHAILHGPFLYKSLQCTSDHMLYPDGICGVINKIGNSSSLVISEMCVGGILNLKSSKTECLGFNPQDVPPGFDIAVFLPHYCQTCCVTESVLGKALQRCGKCRKVFLLFSRMSEN